MHICWILLDLHRWNEDLVDFRNRFCKVIYQQLYNIPFYLLLNNTEYLPIENMRILNNNNNNNNNNNHKYIRFSISNRYSMSFSNKK